ncbi:putative MFS multidrug transporter [Xylogone sp. PMI_703]|nr:putative MFS multidrug transporter [Xylogone sp. PMI_703]
MSLDDTSPLSGQNEKELETLPASQAPQDGSKAKLNEETPAAPNEKDLEKGGDLQPRDESASEKIQPQATVHPLTDLDKGIIGWDSQDDPANPLNFPSSKKWGLLMLMTAMTFVSPLASSMFAPAVSFMGEEFHVTTETLLSFAVTVYLLGWVCGPLFLAPLSEIYGRRVVLSCANIFFVVWQIGCAKAPNIASLIIFRFLAGIGGAGCLTLGGGLVADLFDVTERGMATSIWSLGTLFGPVVGPICGVAIELLNTETYAKVLIRWKTNRLSKELNRNDLRSCYDPENSFQSPGRVILEGLKRPIKMFYKSPIVFLMCCYMSIIFGLLYLLFTTIPLVFQSRYGWEPELTGLSYLGIGLGYFTGLAAIATTSDRSVVRLTKRNGGKFEPEMRLPIMFVFAWFVPISFFWYGWAAERHTHWAVPIVGTIWFSFGMMGIFLPIQTYLIDCYTMYAASAVAILTTTRSLVGALLPLAGPKMYDALGLGWGNSLLGFIALGCIPIPLFFTRYGKMIREKYPLNL